MAASETAEEEGYGDAGSRIYKASGGSRKNPMLLIIPHPTNPVRVTCKRLKQFSDIRDVQVTRDGRILRIDFSDIVVIAKGRVLEPVALAIGGHTCSRIEAFDAERRDMPTDISQSFIETIAYYTRDQVEAEETKDEATAA